MIGVDRGRDVLIDELPTAAGHGLAFCRAIYHTSPDGRRRPGPGRHRGRAARRARRPGPEPPWRRCPGSPGAHGLPRRRVPRRRHAAPESPRTVVAPRRASCSPSWGCTAVVGPELEYYLCEPDALDADGLPQVRRQRRQRLRRRPQGRPATASCCGRCASCATPTCRSPRPTTSSAPASSRSTSTTRELVDAADRAFRMKSAVQEIARHEGLLATFMAKPFNDEGGSGFHLHVSLVDEARDERLRRRRRRVRAVRHRPARDRRRAAARPGARRPGEPDDQLLQAVRPGHPGALADRLGPGQPQRDGAHSRRSAARARGWRSGWATRPPTPT